MEAPRSQESPRPRDVLTPATHRSNNGDALDHPDPDHRAQEFSKVAFSDWIFFCGHITQHHPWEQYGMPNMGLEAIGGALPEMDLDRHELNVAIMSSR